MTGQLLHLRACACNLQASDGEVDMSYCEDAIAKVQS